jgi:hypothetical protein
MTKCSTKIYVTTEPSLIQSNWGERSTRLVKQKVALKENITVEPLFKNYKKTIHLFIDRRLRSCTFIECNDAGLKKLSGFVCK